MIRKFIAIAALCLASTMAFATVAMADPAPDICVLDLSQPATLDLAINTAGMTCATLAAVEVADAVPIMPDGEDAVAGQCKLQTMPTLDFSSHRQHEDPGRCLG